MKVGIVGLPNVGKSTLFNALTRSSVAASNFPFTTIDPNVGVVPVPDPRLEQLSEIVSPTQTIPATVQFVDIAGLVGGAAQGEGLGNKFLGHIREVDAIAEVVRAFTGTEIHHVAGSLEPSRDIETIETELALADLETLSRRRSELEARVKADPKLAPALGYLNSVEATLAEAKPARSVPIPREAESLAHDLHLLTAKPLIYVANVDERPDENLVGPIRAKAEAERSPLVLISAQIEAELNELSEQEKRQYLADLDQDQPGLETLIQAGYRLLGLQSFFTAGPKEVRAWTVRVGATAPEAAGVIHTDFEKHFIRAEVISFTDFTAHGGEAGAKSAGKLRIEGRDYIMQDDDIVHFRTSA